MPEVEDNLFVDEVPDEALEEPGRCHKGAVNYTFFFCTAFDLCPGP